ncbi:MAG TPA: amidohydrolase [Desulfurobacteriaceae bacterium]|nr:amidohydrolase [Desulfurobacteriaceae bacterium]
MRGKIMSEKLILKQATNFAIEKRKQIIPELSGKEEKTSKLIFDTLKELGYKPYFLENTYNVLCKVDVSKEKTLAIRADIDALPFGDKVIHACGHDFHTATLLGLAYIFSKEDFRKLLKTNLLFIFQSSEEVRKFSGAEAVVKAGILEKENVEAIFGFHVYPELPVGKIGVRSGPMMAGSDVFEFIIKGQASHASRPHLSNETISALAQLITKLNIIPSRKINPLYPALISIGIVQAGTAENVIPDRAYLRGTVRYYSKEVRNSIFENMKKAAKSVDEFFGTNTIFNIIQGNEPVINDKSLVDLLKKVVIKYLGVEAFEYLEYPSMGSEDFSEYLKVVKKGCYFRVGVGGKYPLHNPLFKATDNAIYYALTSLYGVAINYE